MRSVTKRARNYGTNNALDDALFNDHDAHRTFMYEQPWHRLAVQYACKGLKYIDIAVMVGHTSTAVSEVLRQPWARQMIIEKTKTVLQDEIKALLEREMLPSLQKLAEVRDSEKSKASEVISASNSLLNRGMGMPTQLITTNESVNLDNLSTEDLERLVAQDAAKNRIAFDDSAPEGRVDHLQDNGDKGEEGKPHFGHINGDVTQTTVKGE